MADNNLQENAGAQGQFQYEGGEASAWAADLTNFTVPQGGELPRTVERRIVNDKAVKDRFDARKW